MNTWLIKRDEFVLGKVNPRCHIFFVSCSGHKKSNQSEPLPGTRSDWHPGDRSRSQHALFFTHKHMYQQSRERGLVGLQWRDSDTRTKIQIHIHIDKNALLKLNPKQLFAPSFITEHQKRAQSHAASILTTLRPCACLLLRIVQTPMRVMHAS